MSELIYTLYPEIDPYNAETLKVSDLHEIHLEEVGNPKGTPVVFLHGGPGVGIHPDYRRFIDPNRFRVVLPDQRGAGKSTPHAELRDNTTWTLIDDLETLRKHLNIERWIVFGGSWGSTLALCYAITYPQSVAGIVIRGVFLARPDEIEWLHGNGMRWIYPDEWERFVEIVPLKERGDMVAAYHRLLNEGDEEMQLRAAAAWSRWEASTMNLIPDPEAIADFSDPHKALSIGRIENHFTYHKFFMPSDNFILENIEKIRDIPLHIVQGRYDVICPMKAAWDLHKAVPGSKLTIVQDGAHSPMDAGMVDGLIKAVEGMD